MESEKLRFLQSLKVGFSGEIFLAVQKSQLAAIPPPYIPLLLKLTEKGRLQVLTDWQSPPGARRPRASLWGPPVSLLCHCYSTGGWLGADAGEGGMGFTPTSPRVPSLRLTTRLERGSDQVMHATKCRAHCRL